MIGEKVGENLVLLVRKFVKQYNRMMLLQYLPNVLTEKQALQQVDYLRKKTANNPWLFQPVHYAYIDEQYAIVYEDFTGEPLAQLIKQNHLPIHQVIQIAIELANACVNLHQNGEVYEYLNPNTILVNPQSFEVKLISPSSLKWSFTSEQLEQEMFLGEYIRYIAPEQTGRLVSGVDERTDLYTIGAFLYESITKTSLFEGQDSGEVIFRILTKSPDFQMIRHYSPLESLTELIKKLLKKEKEERYQTALGLRYDLLKIMDLLVGKNSEETFNIGEQDRNIKPKISNKLYGRETELTILKNIVNKVKNGSKEIVFLQGVSGSGKSSIARALSQNIIVSKGFFLESKFEQLKQQHSLAPIVAPFRQLLKQIYLEGEKSIQVFKQSMVDSDLTIMNSLLQLIPELNWFTDEKNRVTQESKQYTLQLNAYIFSSIQKLMGIFTKQKRPIVMFIDDLQWAENSALDMLKQIYAQHAGGYFLLITVIRHNQDEIHQSILIWQKELEASSFIFVRLLSKEIIYEWVADTLNCDNKVAEYFANRLYYMTQGNALFVQQAFQMFLKDKTIYYDTNLNSWQYDEQQLSKSISTNELLKFIESRLELLSKQSVEVLHYASCFGSVFDFYYLAKLTEIPVYQLFSCIEELVSNGFIVSFGNNLHSNVGNISEKNQQMNSLKFQFIHDRIQQVAYEIYSHEARVKTHFQISRLLQEFEWVEDNLQELVRQLNYCKELLSLADQKQLAIWNYELGNQAKQAGIYENARQFYLESIELLPQDKWVSMHEYVFSIYLNIGECEYLAGHYKQSKQYIEEALAHANTNLEKLKVYRLMTLIYIEVENTELGLAAGLKALEIGRQNISRKPSKLQLVKEYTFLKFALRRKTNEQLLNLKPINNEEVDVLIQIMINMLSNSFLNSQNLSGILLMRSMRLQLKHGAASESAIVVINYALLLISGTDSVKEALRFGQLALSMVEKQESLYVKSRVYFIYSIFLNHWIHDYHTSINYMRLTQQYMEQLGLYYNVNATSCFLCNAQLIAGNLLEDIYDEIQYQQIEYGKYPSVLAEDYLEELKHWIECLQNPSLQPNWDARITLNAEEAVNVMHYTLRLRMAYLYKNEEEIERYIRILSKQSKKVFALPSTPIYYFFKALCHFDLIHKEGSFNSFSRNNIRKSIHESISRLKKWSEEAPHQYAHLYFLLLAEYASVKYDFEQAELYYDRAIQLSKTYKFMHDEAIIYERAATFYRKRNDTTKTTDYITRAVKKMKHWGGHTIAQQWETEFEGFIVQPFQEKKYSVSFDMLGLFEATQTIATETTAKEMLPKLLIALLKQSNATSGYLIRLMGEKASIYARVTSDSEQLDVMPFHGELDDTIRSIVDYALQVNEPVSERTIKNKLYNNDGHLAAKSFICLPIQYKGSVQAFLYLENNLLNNAFNNIQVDILRIITTQIVITLENAEIYAEMEERVNRRTKKLDEINHSLKEANNRLAINEEERKRLLHSISHELRSPITSTLGYIDLILDDVVTEPNQQKQYLQRSRDRLLSLNALIQDLFDLAKLESGRTDFQFERISVQHFYDCFAHRYKLEVTKAGIEYKVNAQFDDKQYIYIDVRKIEQVINNLITNAIKYTEEGVIEFSLDVNETALNCTIKDSGLGIPKGDLPFIFDIYYRASNSHREDSHGIGLSICKKIIEKHDGTLMVDSIEGNGSSFTFTIPLIQDQT